MTENAPSGPVVNRRPYHSPRREARAAATRSAIVASAHALFTSEGYVATTVDDVARAAGVSRPTVFLSVGGKPELLKLVRDRAIAGDDRDIAMPDRDMFQRVWDEPDQRKTLALYAGNMRVVHGRVADVEHVLQGAAQSDPDLKELAATALRQRRYGCGRVAASLASKGPLRQGLTVRSAGDVLYALASPDAFRMLTTTCGWTPARYQRWLADTLARELLPD